LRGNVADRAAEETARIFYLRLHAVLPSPKPGQTGERQPRGTPMARITFLSRMTVKAGREQDFVRACNDLAAQVRANEKELVYYEFFKLREPRRYAVLESFPDEAVEHAHMNSPWMARVAPAIMECLDGPFVREYLDPFEA